MREATPVAVTQAITWDRIIAPVSVGAPSFYPDIRKEVFRVSAGLKEHVLGHRSHFFVFERGCPKYIVIGLMGDSWGNLVAADLPGMAIVLRIVHMLRI